jgi:hypothetical protein
VPLPTGPELEVQGILRAQNESDEQSGKKAPTPLKLAQVRDAIERRRGPNEPPPPLTTLSSTLRNAVAHGLLKEYRLTGGQPQEVSRSAARAFGAVRSPQTGYVAAYTPEEVMTPLFRQLAKVYPPGQRYHPVIHMARALDLPDDIIDKLEKLLPKP